jgi:DNA uptake protein ComE-like DNA-binding protein
VRFHSYNEELGFLLGLPNESEEKGNPNDDLETVAELNSNRKSTNKFQPTQEGEEKPLEYMVIERKDIALGHGTITYSIEDENSKIGINNASRDLLVKALKQSGMEIGPERDTIADSILDWIDADENHRINGAESDYYRRQSPPYKSKNGRLDTMEELLKIRGITEEILYGNKDAGGKSPGLENFFTLYPVSAVNPNTANEDVLSALFTSEKVTEILEAKEEKGFYSNTLSTIFRVTAVGKIDNSNTQHSIEAIIEKRKWAGKESLLIHYWNDNLIEQ